MAAAGNLTIQANVTGGPDGARTFGPLTVTTNAAVTQTTTLTLTIGANTVTIPTGTSVVVLLPPNSTAYGTTATFGGVLTLKGVSGDTGSSMSIKNPTVLSYDTAPASIVINSTAAGTLVAWFM